MRYLFLLCLLLLYLPVQAKQHKHRRYRDNHIHYKFPPLPVMKERFQEMMQRNREEHFPAWKYR